MTTYSAITNRLSDRTDNRLSFQFRLASLKFNALLIHNGDAGLGGSVGCASDWRPGGRGCKPSTPPPPHTQPQRGRQHSFVEIDHEIFSTVILSLPLIQEGQLSVAGERMCTILVNRLED